MGIKLIKSCQNNNRNMINLGCGSRFHPDFINVDLRSNHLDIQSLNLRNPLPFPDNTFNVVYHSHLLEHFDRKDAINFISECYRVCRPGGILRVVVPDLENIARLYLHFLDQCYAKIPGAETHYKWMMLELYDQVVRKSPGGDMVSFLRDLPKESLSFIRNRIGNDLFDAITQKKIQKSFFQRIIKIDIKSIIKHIRIQILLILGFLIMGRDGTQIINEVIFRSNGEIHQWMYDYYSLKSFLIKIGFVDIRKLSEKESSIKGWESYYLDTEPDGTIYKPNSLFCEATKPE